MRRFRLRPTPTRGNPSSLGHTLHGSRSFVTSVRRYPTHGPILVLGLTAIILGACIPSGPSPQVGDQTTWMIGAGRAEVASAVIPPGANSACPKGRALIVAAAGGESPAVYASDLTLSGTVQTVSAQPLSAFSRTSDDRYLAADIVLTTLPGGGLLMVYQGGSISTLTPQPAWWNDFADPKTNPLLLPGDRGAIFVWRSIDCGTTWDRYPDIDSGDVLGGRCAWPQPTSSGGPGRGGFDREELYVDPWTGRVFLTAGCMNGGYKSYPKQHAHLVFISDDQGKTWNVSPAEFPRWAPLVMTSVPSGRVYFAHCLQRSGGDGLAVGLYWMDPPWQTKQGGVEVFYGDPNDASNRCGQLPAAKLPLNITQPGVIPIGLTRVSSDASADLIRLAYPAVSGGRQVERIVNVRIGTDGSVTTVPVKTIQADDPAGSVLQAAFVETDRFQLKKETNTAMLYWLETASAELVARYALVEGASTWFPPDDLSVLKGIPDPWASGAPAGATPEWAGDYIKGAFFYEAGQLSFLGAWPVPSLSQLRYNIVRLPIPGFVSAQGSLSEQAIALTPVLGLLDGSLPPGPSEHFFNPNLQTFVGGSPVLFATPTFTPAPIRATDPTWTPAPAVACNDKAKFITDVTFPDNTNLPAGAAFTKIWRLRNDGNCPWNEEYKVVFVDGASMANNTPLPIAGVVAPGSTVDLAVDMVAPSTGGTYTGNYQIRNPQGVHFGVGASGLTPFYVKIVVGAPSGPSPTAPPPAADSQAPSVSISHSPSGGSVPTGKTITFTANASDNVGVTRIDIYLTAPGQFPGKVKTCTNTTTCSYTGGPYNTQGNLSYYAVAADAAGHETTSPVTTILIYVVVS